MNLDLPEEAAAILRRAEKEPLLPASAWERGPVLDRAAIENILPHRDPFLLLDQVNVLDLEGGLVAGQYALSRAEAVLAGHFPHRPLWPGVLQVEAIAQAGCVLCLVQTRSPGGANITLTHILGARFVRAVMPGGTVEVVARVLEDGLFLTIVGQCLQNGLVCSAAAMKGFA